MKSNVGTQSRTGERRPIALVTTELRPGGAERNLVSLASGLSSQGFSPHVYSLAPRPPDGQDLLVKFLEDAAIDVSFVNVRSQWQLLLAVRRLRRMLCKQKPILIQSFLFHANVVAALAASGMNMPIVAGLRVAQREPLRRFTERRVANRISAFVCVSRALADEAQHGRGLPLKRLHVIPNGLDPRRFENVSPADLSQFEISPGKRVVLFVGRLEHQKGPDVLIEAATQLLAARDDIHLLIVGEGSMQEELQRQVAAAAIVEHVAFVPWVPDPLPLIAAANVVAIPSRWEGMSNVLLESLALARPVVATDVEGTRELLTPTAQKRMVPIGDPVALASRIDRLLEDENEQSTIPQANREFVRSEFAMSKTISAYTQLYEHLISTR